MIKIIIIFFSSMYLCNAFYKKWINYNTTNMENWNNKFAVGDIFLPSNLSKPIAIQYTDSDYCDVIIPVTNDDIEDSDSLTSSYSDCPYSILQNQPRPAYWIDPRNWNSFLFNEATPHLEKLPCEFDFVDFFNTTNLFVILPNDTVVIRKMYFSYYPMDRTSFEAFVKLDRENISEHMINVSPKNLTDIIQITGTICKDKTGCVCGTRKFYKESCAFINNQCPSSEDLNCTEPIKPINHCCQICGSYIVGEFNPNKFVFDAFVDVIDKFISKMSTKLGINENEIAIHVSKLSNTSIHIIIVNKYKYTSKMVTFADNFKDMIEISSAIGITQVLLESSQPLSEGSDITFKTIVIVMIGIACLFLIVFSYFYFGIEIKELITSFKLSFSITKLTNRATEEADLKAENKENPLISENNLRSDQNNEVTEEETNPEYTVNLLGSF